MDITALLDRFPLWALLPITIGIALLSVEAGRRLAGYRLSHAPEEKESPVGGMVGGTLGFLAFMLAFTFGLASTRFEARRQILLQEANAIGTCYLRAAMLPDPMRTEARNLLREYVDVRLETVKNRSARTRDREVYEFGRLWLLDNIEKLNANSLTTRE